MEDGKHKQERFESEMRVFRHRGEPHYSYKGHFISFRQYAFYKSLGKDRDTIMFEHAESYSDLFRKQDEERKREENYPAIHNFKELAEYVLTLLSKETVEKIRLDRNQCKTVADYIAMFPGVYQPILRLRNAKDKRKKGYEAAELESLEKTLAREMSINMEPMVYNPDAFIEPGTEEVPQ
jgi:hypothetical protein